MNVFPNPARDVATVILDIDLEATVEVAVYDLMGRKLKSMQLETMSGKNVVQLDLSVLESGMYIIRTTSVDLQWQLRMAVDR